MHDETHEGNAIAAARTQHLSAGERSIASLILLAIAAIVWIALMGSAIWILFAWSGLGDAPAGLQRRVALGFALLYGVVGPIIHAVARGFIKAARSV